MLKSIIIALFFLFLALNSSFSQTEVDFTDGGTLIIDRIEELLSKKSINKIKEAAKEDSSKTLTMLASYLRSKGLYMVPTSYRNWIDDQYDQKRLNCRMLIMYEDIVEMKYDYRDNVGDVYGETIWLKNLHEYEIDRLMIVCRKKN